MTKATFSSLLLVLAIGLGLTEPAAAHDDSDATPDAVVRSYVSAWNLSDAATIAALFEAQGDLITPTGYRAQGVKNIEEFYVQAFSIGYAGSKGSFEVLKTRRIAPDVTIIDGHWRIVDARNPDGSARDEEEGLAFAVLAVTSGHWKLLALREQTSARSLKP